MSTSKSNLHFACLNLAAPILRQLDTLGFTIPTPIQSEAIPHVLSGRDVIGIAQTGTGKTLAFGLPMLQQLMDTDGVGLILAPTRELALQIDEELKKVGGSLGLRTAVLIGGAPMNRQVGDLRKRPNVIVATPGRLKDHLWQRTTNLKRVKVVVLDEADRMLDMGFAPAVRQIMDQAPTERQTMLFSATMAREVLDLASQYLKDPIRVEVAPQGTPSELVAQELHVVERENKPDLLGSVLYASEGTVLVFSRTRHGARKVARNVRDLGISAAELHSDRTLAQRKAALAGFKSGEFRVLVATDIAARGIDVKEIGTVVNYDLPDCLEDYVHRIGRTGRAGASGRAVTFAQPDQHKDVRQIEKLIGKDLVVLSGTLPPAPTGRPFKAAKQAPNHRPHRPADSKGELSRTERSRDRKPFQPRGEGNTSPIEENSGRERNHRPHKPFAPKVDFPRTERPRGRKPFKPKFDAPVKPMEETPQPERHHRPKPVGTPKKFQKSDSKPRWKSAPNTGQGTHQSKSNDSRPEGSGSKRAGSVKSFGGRPSHPKGNRGPKKFGKR